MSSFSQDDKHNKKQSDSQVNWSNGEYTSSLDSISMQPPEFSLDSKSANEKYKDFTDSIDSKENLNSPLFSGNQVLEEVFDNTNILGKGSTGEHILKVKKVLENGGLLKKEHVNENFDTEFEQAIMAVQSANGAILTDGIIGPETMRILDDSARSQIINAGECDSDTTKNLIGKVKSKFKKDKSLEDAKSWFDKTRSDLPDISIKILNLYERHLNGAKIDDRYITSRKMPYSVERFIKDNGTEQFNIYKRIKYPNKSYKPFSRIQKHLFSELDAYNSEAQIIKIIEQRSQSIVSTIGIARKYGTGFNGHTFPSAGKLLRYMKQRGNNKNDIYSAFI